MAEKKETGISLAERFTNSVVAAYADVAKGVAVNERERTLIANYYVTIDNQLKNPKSTCTWKDINMNELALSIAHLSKLGLDAGLEHVSFIPFRNKKTGRVSMVPCKSAKGYEFIAKQYGIDPPKNLTVELVYETDEFTPIKKDFAHECDSYMFNIRNPFNRGKVIGGFGYLEFDDKSKNKLLAMSLAEIRSYKPALADDTFWREGTQNSEKMYKKTIAKQLFKTIAIDPNKVHGVRKSFDYMEAEELKGASLSAQAEISEKNGVGDFVDVDYEPIEGVENPVEAVEDAPVDENEVVTPEDDVLGMNETLFK